MALLKIAIQNTDLIILHQDESIRAQYNNYYLMAKASNGWKIISNWQRPGVDFKYKVLFINGVDAEQDDFPFKVENYNIFAHSALNDAIDELNNGIIHMEQINYA